MIRELLLTLLCSMSLIQAGELSQHEQEAAAIQQAQGVVIKFMFRDAAGEVQEIQRAFVDPLIRDLPANKLKAIMPHLVFTIKQLDNGELENVEYCIRAHVKGLGSGPITAIAAKGTVWAGFAVLCSQEGPLCMTHYAEFNMAAEAAYWAVFFVPWLP